MTAGLLTVTREPAAGSAQLRDDWLDLEGRASPTVFLSWQWLGHWLHVYQPRASVLRVKEGERLVGLGLVMETDERRHGVMKSRCLRLHQTGHKLLDLDRIQRISGRTRKGRRGSRCLSAVSVRLHAGLGRICYRCD